MIPIDFQVTCLKVKVKPLFSAQCVVCSISFDPLTWSIPNLVQGLHPISRWFLLIFRAHVQRSRSNYSSEPSVLFTIYILIPCLLALDRFCFYREDKPEFCTMGGIYACSFFYYFEFHFRTWYIWKASKLKLKERENEDSISNIYSTFNPINYKQWSTWITGRLSYHMCLGLIT